MRAELAFFPAVLGQVYVIDDDATACTLASFLDANEDLSNYAIASIACLGVGDTYRDGGGAASTWEIRRIQ